ncbi:glycosyltransferase family 2 protein [Bariatricus sp. HCP28S3_A7]|uniref:glycosyltransferase family 2 protein n=1 Tax=Bariatricus sp. HCP28S3_A7 TaxID=3438894 RepID=UPI003F8B19A9
MVSISVIIPYYYGNKYLEKLYSMLSRNVNNLNEQEISEVEVLLVNDSPADTIAAPEKEVPFTLRIVNNAVNMGIHRTRLQGLAAACGEYIFFLDQDDEIAEEFLSSQMKKLLEDQADVVICNGYVEASNCERKELYSNGNMQKRCKSIFAYCAVTNPIVSPGQAIIRKSAIPKNWTEYTFKSNGADDLMLWLDMLENGCKFALNPQKLYIHCDNDTNASKNHAVMYASNKEVFENLHWEKHPVLYRIMVRRVSFWEAQEKRRSAFNILKYLDVVLLRVGAKFGLY